jgi:hypothetical protein
MGHVAVVQDAPVLYDLPATLDRLARLTAEAAAAMPARCAKAS